MMKYEKIVIKRSFLILFLFFFLFELFAENDPIVYITKSGKKYHTATCSYLKKSKIPIQLSEAVARGYTSCSRCNPPTIESVKKSSASSANQSQSLYKVNVYNLTSYTQADISKCLRAKVIKHVDGDTVYVKIENPPSGINHIEKIRMIGVDTPETVDPRKPVQYFGKQASNFTKKRLLGKTVYLAFDWNLRGKYGRLLAYIYLPDGSCHNADLIREGYGHAYIKFPFQFLDEFRELEKYAREHKNGLWQ